MELNPSYQLQVCWQPICYHVFGSRRRELITSRLWHGLWRSQRLSGWRSLALPLGREVAGKKVYSVALTYQEIKKKKFFLLTSRYWIILNKKLHIYVLLFLRFFTLMVNVQDFTLKRKIQFPQNLQIYVIFCSRRSTYLFYFL